MKFFKHFLILAVAVLAFVSCGKDAEPVDARDAFVGTYSYTLTGSYTLYKAEKAIGTIPVEGEGTLRCSKVGNDDQVLLSGDGIGDMNGSVSGNKLVLDPTTVSTTYEGMSLQITYTYQPAKKDGNTVTCMAKLTGSAYYQSVSYPLSGNITLVAVKQ